MYTRKKHHHIYDIIANKFFQKLNTTFENEEILDRIKSIEDKKIVTEDKKIKIITVKVKPIVLPIEYSPADYIGISEWLKCKLAKNFIKLRIDTSKYYSNISNITNCETTGTFHKWEVKNGELICSICDIPALKASESLEMAEKILREYKLLIMQKLTQKYCKSGELHNYIAETNAKCNICKNCNKVDTDQLKKKGFG